MCKIVFHSLLNVTHITRWFMFVPLPNPSVVAGHRPLVERRSWATQTFWRGAPVLCYKVSLCENFQLQSSRAVNQLWNSRKMQDEKVFSSVWNVGLKWLHRRCGINVHASTGNAVKVSPQCTALWRFFSIAYFIFTWLFGHFGRKVDY